MNPDPPVSLWPDPDALGPVTDLYQLTMMAGYFASCKDRQRATFEMFVRRLPKNRAYLVFAGLEQAIGDLLRLAFSREQVEALRHWPVFANVNPDFFDRLLTLRFEGDLWSVPEGTVVFPGEPLIRVEAPLAQAQWIETFLLASIGYATLVATKAARIVEAAAGRPVHDFGARRAPGPHAGLIAARSSYLAGCSGTSHVEAARRLGIPCVGTMAHSWVQSFDSESEAFSAFVRSFPGAATMLVDTYDTEAGVAHAAAIEPPIQAIRLDSGDLDQLARKARALLDDRGRHAVRIFASGDLDEWSIARLVASGTPIDAFGVGTEMATSRDAPALAVVYKLVAIDGAGRIKLSPGKKTYPLGKQIHRVRDRDGRFACDRVSRFGETTEGEPLMVPILREGKLVNPLPDLDSIRRHSRQQLADLPDRLRGPDAEPGYPIEYSDALEAEAERMGVRSPGS
jgi:nicotinate phosphoribosyltransferase